MNEEINEEINLMTWRILTKAFIKARLNFDAVGLIHYHTLQKNLPIDRPDGSRTAAVIPWPET